MRRIKMRTALRVNCNCGRQTVANNSH